MANHALRRKRKFTDKLLKKLIIITAVVLSLLIIAMIIVSAVYISKKSSGGVEMCIRDRHLKTRNFIFVYIRFAYYPYNIKYAAVAS